MNQLVTLIPHKVRRKHRIKNRKSMCTRSRSRRVHMDFRFLFDYTGPNQFGIKKFFLLPLNISPVIIVSTVYSTSSLSSYNIIVGDSQRSTPTDQTQLRSVQMFKQTIILSPHFSPLPAAYERPRYTDTSLPGTFLPLIRTVTSGNGFQLWSMLRDEDFCLSQWCHLTSSRYRSLRTAYSHKLYFPF